MALAWVLQTRLDAVPRNATRNNLAQIVGQTRGWRSTNLA
jgi:hypothetical protein